MYALGIFGDDRNYRPKLPAGALEDAQTATWRSRRGGGEEGGEIQVIHGDRSTCQREPSAVQSRVFVRLQCRNDVLTRVLGISANGDCAKELEIRSAFPNIAISTSRFPRSMGASPISPKLCDFVKSLCDKLTIKSMASAMD